MPKTDETGPWPARGESDLYDMQPSLREIDRVVAAGPFADSWASLSAFRVPRWYEEAKFGIFIHWGVYSVPAFGSEWYPRNMYIQGSPEFEHHVKTYGPHSQFGYKDFIPLFRAVRSRGVGGAVSGSGRTLRRARGRAPRRLPDVPQRHLPLERL